MTDNIRDEENAGEKNNIKSTKTAIDWRREFVLQKLSRGWSQSDISKELQLHPSTISLDVQFLKEQAQEELRTHIKERIPFEYQRGRVALNNLIYQANKILDSISDDNKMKLQVINTLANLWIVNSNLNSEGNIIQQAYDKVQTLEEIQKRRSEEAIFSGKEVKEYYQQEGESAEDVKEDDKESEEDIQEEEGKE